MCLYPNCFQCYSPVADREAQGTNSTPIMIPGAKKQRPESAGYKSKVGSQGNTTNFSVPALSKKLSRVPIVFDLDIVESPLIKVLAKKFKQQ